MASKRNIPVGNDPDVVAAIRDYSAAKKSDRRNEADQYEQYALSLVSDLRRLSNFKFSLLKVKMATLLHDLEFGDHDSRQRKRCK